VTLAARQLATIGQFTTFRPLRVDSALISGRHRSEEVGATIGTEVAPLGMQAPEVGRCRSCFDLAVCRSKVPGGQPGTYAIGLVPAPPRKKVGRTGARSATLAYHQPNRSRDWVAVRHPSGWASPVMHVGKC